MNSTFDRIGYIKQILDSDTARADKAVLTYLATYCDTDRTISVSVHSAKKIAIQVSMTNNTVGASIQRLKDAKLLTIAQRKRRKFFLLPTEEKLALYTPKK